MKRTILVSLVLVSLSVVFPPNIISQSPLEPPLPQGSTYYKGRIVSQMGVGVIGCSNTDLLLGDASGCLPITSLPASGVSAIIPGTNMSCTPDVSGQCVGNVTVNSNGSSGAGPGVTVTCGGTDDYAVIQTALTGMILSNGGTVYLSSPTGLCNTSTHGHLTVYSNTILDLGGIMLTGAPSGSTDSVILNYGYGQRIGKTCTDVVMTVNNDQITSATCSFAPTDADYSVDCVGAYAGGTDWLGNALPTDLHTTIAGVINTTTAILADNPTAVSNPMTCNFYERDNNIVIRNGSVRIIGSSVGSPIRIKTANNVTVQNVNLWGGASVSSTSGTANLFFQDVSDVVAENIQLHGWAQNQDGIDAIGPIHNYTLSHIRGHSGDNFVTVSTTFGCPVTGEEQQDCSTYGNVDGVSIHDVKGASYAFGAGVDFYGNEGTPMYVRNVHGDDIFGDVNAYPPAQAGSYFPGFLSGEVAFNMGYFQNIQFSHLYGGGAGQAVYVGGTNLVNIDKLTISDIMCPTNVNSGGVTLGNTGVTIGYLDIDNSLGQQSYTSTPTSAPCNNALVTQDYGTTVTNEIIRGVTQSVGTTSITAISGVVKTLTISDTNITYTPNTSATFGAFNFAGATITNLSVLNTVLTHAGIGPMYGVIVPATLIGSGCATICPASISNIFVDNFRDLSVANYGDEIIVPLSSNVGNVLINNSQFNNINSCVSTAVSGSILVANTLATNVNDNSCAQTIPNPSEFIATCSWTNTLFNSMVTLNTLNLSCSPAASTLANGSAGQTITFNICAPAGGAYTWAWPSNVRGGMTGTAPPTGKCSVQSFVYSASAGAWLASSAGSANE